MRRVRTSTIAIITAAALAGCSGTHTTGASPVKESGGGKIVAYVSTDAGSPESILQLQQTKQAGFDGVVSYGSMNGQSVEDVQHYLDQAAEIGIDVTFSVKDVLGKTDADHTNASRHRQLFGRTTDAQITSVVSNFIGYKAVKNVLISDEQPTDSSEYDAWKPRLEKRYAQIHPVKPTSIVLYWNPGDLQFYRNVKRYADELQVDYYPGRGEGKFPIQAISDIGDALWQVAGDNGTFVLQAFGWDPENHPEGVEHGFTEKVAPPTGDEMITAAKLAVEGKGHGGAMNLAFYSLDDPNASSLDDVTYAIQHIRNADWWKNRGA